MKIRKMENKESAWLTVKKMAVIQHIIQSITRRKPT